MNLNNLLNKGLLLVLSLALFTACDFSNEPELIENDFVRFTSPEQIFIVLEDGETANLDIALMTSNIPESSKSFTFEVLSDVSTAQEGVHYDLSGNTVSFANGELTSTLPLTVYRANLTEPVTLVLSFGSNFNQTLTLTLSNPIREALIGNYAFSYPWVFGDGEFAQALVGSDDDRSAVTAPSMLEEGFDIDFQVFPTSDSNVYSISTARQNAWTSGSWGQITVQSTANGTYNLSLGQLDISLGHFVPDGRTFGSFPMVMRKLN
jgi:hypothetical protein